MNALEYPDLRVFLIQMQNAKQSPVAATHRINGDCFNLISEKRSRLNFRCQNTWVWPKFATNGGLEIGCLSNVDITVPA